VSSYVALWWVVVVAVVVVVVVDVVVVVAAAAAAAASILPCGRHLMNQQTARSILRGADCDDDVVVVVVVNVGCVAHCGGGGEPHGISIRQGHYHPRDARGGIMAPSFQNRRLIRCCRQGNG